MDNDSQNIRIKDISKMAGVSVGTVDRVLHGRGRVSEKSLKKVEAVLKMVNYQPNIFARSLVSSRQYNIAAIIPYFEPGEYWEIVSQGIDKAILEFKDYGVRVQKLFFDQYHIDSLKKSEEVLFEQPFDGVLMATLFSELIISISQRLSSIGIPFNYIDSNIPGQNQLAYFGSNSFSGGNVGAKMMLSIIGNKSDILIVRMIPKGEQSSIQFINRSSGFLEYLQKVGYLGKVHHVDLEIGNPVNYFSELDQVFNKKNKIKGAIVFNSSSHSLANYMKVRDMKDITLIGYDVIEKNAEMLRADMIYALIAQRPYQQGYEGIKSLCEYLISQKVPSKENYLPIDILVKENLDYYINQ